MNKDILKALTKRIVSSVVTLFLLISFLFILVRLSPGDPTQKFLSPDFSPELRQKVTASFKLDQPITEQYVNFLANILQLQAAGIYGCLAVFFFHISFCNAQFYNPGYSFILSCNKIDKEERRCSRQIIIEIFIGRLCNTFFCTRSIFDFYFFC